MIKQSLLITTALMAAPLASAYSSNDIGFDARDANLYCQDLAESYQVLDEDRGSYMTNCIAEYRESPPGSDTGSSDISPHAASY